EHQSPESIRYRFFQYRKNFSREDVAQMVQIDYDREMVFIANAPREDGEGEETLGTVRTWTDADNQRSEFAVMVDDRMKGEGLGVALMQKMIEDCRARGTMEMVGNVLPENRPMLQRAEQLGFEIKFNPEEEVMDLRLVLNEPEKDWQKERLKKRGHYPPLVVLSLKRAQSSTMAERSSPPRASSNPGIILDSSRVIMANPASNLATASSASTSSSCS